MQIKLPRSIKSKIKEERDKAFLEMSRETIREQEIIKKINKLELVNNEDDVDELDRYKEMQRDSLENWENLNKKYKAYSDMIKPLWRVSPDTLVIAGCNLAGIVLVLNFEKMDIVRSKAMSLLLKGRV